MSKKKSFFGYDIVMTHSIALPLTMRLLSQEAERLLARYPSRFLFPKNEVGAKETGLLKEILEKLNPRPLYIEELGEDGVFGGLWKLGEALDCGLSVDLCCIPVEQRTIEVCEYVDKNPYMGDSRGAFLIATLFGQAQLKYLQERLIPAVLIGRLTETKARVVDNRGETRFLTPSTCVER